MAQYHYTSPPHQEGLEVNRDDEGLQRKADFPTQPGLEHNKKYDVFASPYVPSGNEWQKTEPTNVRRNPYGLTPLIFGLWVALITALVVGAVVGGGVGGALSSSNKDNTSCSQPPATTTTITTTAVAPSSTPTTNVTNYAAVLPQNVQTVEWTCPTIATFTVINQNPNQNFAVSCGVDYGNSRAAVEGGIVADIVGILAYSAQDCMEACANLNALQLDWGYATRCAGITFTQTMSADYAALGANCWMKNGTAVNPVSCPRCLSASVVT